jgi:hypothetical protein
VEFYRRVEMGCYGNGPNIHPGAEGRTEKNKKKKIKRVESKTATALRIEECCTGCSKIYVTTITKVTDMSVVQKGMSYLAGTVTAYSTKRAWLQLTAVIAWVHFEKHTVPMLRMLLVTYILFV